jgi:cysteine desulfurase/selenocysteine lyase
MTMAELTQPDFPILRRIVNGRPLVFLDSAASSQKPTVVLEAMTRYYEQSHANVHRSIHTLGEEATELYEGARDAVRAFIGAASREEVIFTRGTTEGVNLVAQAIGRTLKPGDEILVTEMEHHSNLIPWQMACRDSGARLVAVPVLDGAHLDMASFDRLLSPRTRVAAFAHVSNVLGTINPVAEMTRRAHAAGALVLVDGAQAVPHLPLDMAGLGADFYVFSGHKMLGPTGIGVLYGRRAVMETLEPAWGGGEMIKEVWIDRAQWNDLPWRFEPGTPPIAAAVGLHAAVGYLDKLGMTRVAAHEQAITGPVHRRALGDRRCHRLRAAEPGDQGRRGGLQRRGDPPARRGGAPRPAGHRRPRRAPLRPAAHEAARHRGHAAGELLRLHLRGRHRAASPPPSPT